tara:strand:- start:472 stop:861 length:390 start_codon:yes stop_codon:yes gene_type:complete
MPCLRRKYHGVVVYLSPEIKDGKRPLCGQTVPVIKGDEWSNVFFDGFINKSFSTGENEALITGITGYTPGEQYFSQWIDINVESLLIGIYTVHGVKLVLDNEKPVIVGKRVLPGIDYNVIPSNVYKIGK